MCKGSTDLLDKSPVGGSQWLIQGFVGLFGVVEWLVRVGELDP